MAKGAKFYVTSNSRTAEDWQDGLSSRNPSWCVAFWRFDQPVSLYSSESEYQKTRQVQVIENDCIAVSINRPKNSITKEAVLTLKVGQLYYPTFVSPGDWVAIWMSDNQDDIDAIVAGLAGAKGPIADTKPNYNFNGWNSGLKFIGRVVSSGEHDNVSMNGVRLLTDTVRCRAFTELQTSVYYTYISKRLMNPLNKASDQVSFSNFYELQADKILSGIAQKFEAFWTKLDVKNRTPDMMIALMYVIVLGAERDKNLVNNIGGVLGTPNEAIEIPAPVAAALGHDGKKHLWEVMNLYVGLQKFNKDASKPWLRYSPMINKSSASGGNIYFSPYRCKGFLPYLYSPVWDNQTIWQILHQFLNPVVNEMFTSLRVNPKGKMLPSITVREIPLSTNLYSRIEADMKGVATIPPSADNTSSGIAVMPQDTGTQSSLETASNPVEFQSNMSSQENWHASFEDVEVQYNLQQEAMTKALKLYPTLSERTLYASLPRWSVAESMITSVNTTTDDSRRVNFFMVWGRSKSIEIENIVNGAESYLSNQLLNKNFVADIFDIRRHGLRANITETKFDFIEGVDGSLTPKFARMRADWYLNSHLKLYGTINCAGITAPICEGDNLEVRGILYHIEGLSFNGSISADGRKSFTTTIQVSNGLVASSVDSASNVMPKYMVQRGVERASDRYVIPAPGITDMQLTSKDNRDDEGELTKE